MSVAIIVGDVRDVLARLPAESVHCVVTSPPYFGLRDYGVEGQIGLEANMREHIAVLVEVFRHVRRVLRKDGTLWLNYGDAYANDGKWGGSSGGKHAKALHGQTGIGRGKTHTGLKPKDRMLLPARVAIALQDDGWWVRDEIVWHKPNPMPCSVTDRTTPAHEMIYLLSKSARYFYDGAAIREPFADNRQGRDYKMPDGRDTVKSRPASERNRGGREDGFTKPNAIDPSLNGGRNRRSVWTVAPQPFKQAHFATFPPKLIEPCILAGCPKGGIVLDPFFGAGTTGLVAQAHGRACFGIELNPAYAEIARARIPGATVLHLSPLAEAAE